MKKLLIVLLFPCTLQAQVIYPMVVNQSQLSWEGNPLVGGGHTGTIGFKYGTISTNESGTILKGEFVLNMHTLENADIEDEQSAKDLVNHLKSDDFFSVNKFPEASFELTKTARAFKYARENEYEITGLLTIRGITHPISFPANIKIENGVIKADARITIDRTRWGVNYQSKSIFASLKDGIIADEIIIVLRVVFDNC